MTFSGNISQSRMKNLRGAARGDDVQDEPSQSTTVDGGVRRTNRRCERSGRKMSSIVSCSERREWRWRRKTTRDQKRTNKHSSRCCSVKRQMDPHAKDTRNSDHLVAWGRLRNEGCSCVSSCFPLSRGSAFWKPLKSGRGGAWSGQWTGWKVEQSKSLECGETFYSWSNCHAG